MEAFHGLLFILSIFLFITGQQHNEASVLSGPHVKSCRPPHTKYFTNGILYYGNAVCTFQLQLLKAGDIQPNPGPTTGNREFTTLNIATNESQQKHGDHLYNRTQLLNLQHFRRRLNTQVWTTIKSLGIQLKPKTQRGCRGGRSRQKHKISVPTTSNHQTGTQPLNCKFALWNARSVCSKIPMIK